jgi:NADH dehydrogenase
MREVLAIILDTIDRERMFMPLPFGLAKAMTLLLRCAPSPLTLTPDQVDLLRSDNVVSESARAAGLTLEGLGIPPDSLQAIVPEYLWRFRATGQFRRKSA